MLQIGRSRLRHHRSALVVLTTTALIALVVLGFLQLLGGVVSDAAARSTLTAADPALSTISARASVKVDQLPQARAVVDAAAAHDGAVVTEVFEAISRGMQSRPESDRARLAVVGDLPRWTRLVAGAYPVAGASALQVVLPRDAATAGGWQVGDTIDLVDLVADGAPTMPAIVTGIVEAIDPTDPIWLDQPLMNTGVEASDSFTLYGPFLFAEGDLAKVAGRSVSARWRIERPETGVTRANALAYKQDAERSMRLLTEGDLKHAQVSTQAPMLYAEARDIADRTRIALLTPTILLMLLGGVALTMAALQLAALRTSETALVRARGASSWQVLALAAVDATLVALLSVALAILLIPLVANPLARLGGLSEQITASPERVMRPDVLGPIVAAGIAAAVIVLITAARSGRLRASATPSARSALLGRLAKAGIDVVLIAFGVLGILQLRRYDPTSPRMDPLTLSAPALVIAGLCVLGLRIIPLLARFASGAAARRPGLTLAWGSWQVARRLGGQAGAILLVFLSVAMGALALSQGATVTRAIEDQTRFAVGVPLRVTPGQELRGSAQLNSSYAVLAGGRDRAMAVNVTTAEVGASKDVSLLALDSSAASAPYVPRADVLAGTAWPGALTGLAQPRHGIPLPAGAREVSVRVVGSASQNAGVGDSIFPLVGRVRIELPTGERLSLAAGQLNGPTPQQLTATLPQVDGGWPAGARIVGVSASPTAPYWRPGDLAGVTLSLSGASPVHIDAQPAPVTGKRESRLMNVTVYVPFDEEAAAQPVPVLVTRALADANRLTVGAEFAIGLVGATLPAKVNGILDAVPTAPNPQLAMVADLAAVSAAATRPQGTSSGALSTPLATFWLLAPADLDAARATLDKQPRLATARLDAAEIAQARRDNPVNAGMRAALRLVTSSALALAALGFAAATAGLALARHREAGILLALGTSPRQIRRAVLGERLVVLVLSTLVGLGAGVAAIWAIVALVIGSDGHPQVPAVHTEYGVGALVLFAGAVLALLAAVGLVVVGRTARDPADVLRAGEHA